MIILDMDMPKSCADCELCTGDDYGYEFCVVIGDYDEIRRPKLCPIVAEINREEQSSTSSFGVIGDF